MSECAAACTGPFPAFRPGSSNISSSRLFPSPTSFLPSLQAPSAAEFAQLSSLLQHKCDENDDLTNNLRLAKDSLRHLSQELDEKSEAAERLKVSCC